MATAEEVLAKVTANTDVLRGVAVIADTLNEGQETIEGLIADLKAQIAAGQTPTDLSAIEAALADQATVIDGMSKAIASPRPPAEPLPV